jgi:hypothetical protein
MTEADYHGPSSAKTLAKIPCGGLQCIALPDHGWWLGTGDLEKANGRCGYAMRLLIPTWQRIGPNRQLFQILHQICHSSARFLSHVKRRAATLTDANRVHSLKCVRASTIDKLN